jgi:predicted transcriptional regulator
VEAGGGRFGAPRLVRAVALVCAAEHAPRLVYARSLPDPGPGGATPIGEGCRLCHRPDCAARALPPAGRALVSDETHRPAAPYSLADD